jgi:hypothetical protein
VRCCSQPLPTAGWVEMTSPKIYKMSNVGWRAAAAARCD